MRVDIINNAVDLNMDEWALAQAGDYLETGGAATCGIVAVLNHTQALAWMVHQNAPYMTDEDTREMLGDAEDAAQPTDVIEIHLGGCGEGLEKLKSQQALIDLVKAAFPRINPQMAWGKEAMLAEFVAGRWTIT